MATIKFDNLGAYGREDDREGEVGIDVGFPNGIVFTVLRAGGANGKYKRAVRKYITPAVERKISKGRLSTDEDDALWAGIYVDSIIINVVGAKIGGKEMQFTKPNTLALLKAAPDMFREVRNVCDDMMSFRNQEIRDAGESLGNDSSGNSSGVTKKKTSKS